MIGHNPKANMQADDAPEVAELLRSLPRVSVPADFNASLKARIASAQSEEREFADITALIKELPRVAAPQNFNAQLMARIAAAKSEEYEFADVSELLQELPRVTAPANFDFKLRARIAQAKSEEKKSAFGWFAELFNFSFSWAQAGAALAIVAFIVAGMTYKFMPAKSVAPANSDTIVAKVTEQIQPDQGSNEIASVTPDGRNSLTSLRSPAPMVKIKNTTANLGNTHIVTAPIPPRTPHPPIGDPQPDRNLVAAGTVMIKHTKDGSARVINVSEYSLGQQTAIAHRAVARPVANEIATQIY